MAAMNWCDRILKLPFNYLANMLRNMLTLCSLPILNNRGRSTNSETLKMSNVGQTSTYRTLEPYGEGSWSLSLPPRAVLVSLEL